MLKSRSDDGSDPTTQYFRRGSAASRMSPSDLPKNWCAACATCISAGSSRRFHRRHANWCSRWRRAPGGGAEHLVRIRISRPSLWRSRSEWSTAEPPGRTLPWVLPGLEEGGCCRLRDAAADHCVLPVIAVPVRSSSSSAPRGVLLRASRGAVVLSRRARGTGLRYRRAGDDLRSARFRVCWKASAGRRRRQGQCHRARVTQFPATGMAGRRVRSERHACVSAGADDAPSDTSEQHHVLHCNGPLAGSEVRDEFQSVNCM